MRNAFVAEKTREALVRGAADVVFTSRQDPFVAAVLFQVVIVGQVLEKARRIQKITILVEVAVQKLRDVIRAAHRDAPGENVRLPQGEGHAVIRAETAPRHANRRVVIEMVNQRHDVAENVVLVLEMTSNTLSRMDMAVVPTLAVHGRDAEQL